jgi:hypothetical protein
MGLNAMLAYAVLMQRREIGVRLVLVATPARIALGVVAIGARTVAAGFDRRRRGSSGPGSAHEVDSVRGVSARSADSGRSTADIRVRRAGGVRRAGPCAPPDRTAVCLRAE